ncbi:hypothetical protein Hanom_Chr14g01329721 [Helianthus anomalus]
MFPLYYYRQRHPMNSLHLGILSIFIAFAVDFACVVTTRKVILEAAIFTAVVGVSLTLFAFWAAKRGYDFSFMGPFLFSYLMVILIFGLIQPRVLCWVWVRVILDCQPVNMTCLTSLN